jgi:hypothetical protein
MEAGEGAAMIRRTFFMFLIEILANPCAALLEELKRSSSELPQTPFHFCS